MERLADREIEATAAAVAAAEVEFDRARLEPIDELIRNLDSGGDEVRRTIGDLEATPEGVVYLIDAWQGVLDQLKSAEPAVIACGLSRAAAWARAGGAAGRGGGHRLGSRGTGPPSSGVRRDG